MSSPMTIDGWSVLFASIALISTGAILQDINSSIPRVAHSLPFKLLGMFCILYGTSKSYSMALRGLVLFAVLMAILSTIEVIVSPPGEKASAEDKLEHILA